MLDNSLRQTVRQDRRHCSYPEKGSPVPSTFIILCARGVAVQLPLLACKFISSEFVAGTCRFVTEKYVTVGKSKKNTQNTLFLVICCLNANSINTLWFILCSSTERIKCILVEDQTFFISLVFVQYGNLIFTPNSSVTS